MPARTKVSVEEKLRVVQAILNGWEGPGPVARRLGVNETTIRTWIRKYQAEGVAGLETSGTNRSYSPEIKKAAVEAYLAGEDTKEGICAKFHIRSTTQLESWVKVYNDHGTFKNHTSGGGSYMANTRKTTKEERITIARECLESGKNYGAIAQKYGVSYQQVYTWTHKYEKLGEAGLEDRRGKRKVEQEPRTPEEEKDIEIARLNHQIYLMKAENDLLKKAQDLERGNGWTN